MKNTPRPTRSTHPRSEAGPALAPTSRSGLKQRLTRLGALALVATTLAGCCAFPFDGGHGRRGGGGGGGGGGYSDGGGHGGGGGGSWGHGRSGGR